MEEEGLDIRTCICWIPRGVAAENPSIAEVPEEEVNNEHAKKGKASKATSDKSIADEFRMDEYDDEEADGTSFFGVTKEDLELIEKGDPLVDQSVLQEDYEETQEALKIDKEKDYPVILGTVENGDDCSLETLIYSHSDSANYEHHATILEAFPLCIEWLPVFKSKNRGHIIAVGTFLPVIEIYDNDQIDQLEPLAVLDSKGIHHTDAVASINVNPIEKHYLISASHDGSCILWDLKLVKPLKKYESVSKHKLNCVQWNPNGREFAVGGEDKFVYILCAKSGTTASVQIGEPVEGLCWLTPKILIVVTQEGSLIAVETVEQGKTKLLWEKTICDGPILCASNTGIPGVIVIGCESGIAVIYDLRNPSELIELCSKDLKADALYDVKPSPDVPSLLGFAAKELVIWDLAYEPSLQAKLNLKPE